MNSIFYTDDDPHNNIDSARGFQEIQIQNEQSQNKNISNQRNDIDKEINSIKKQNKVDSQQNEKIKQSKIMKILDQIRKINPYSNNNIYEGSIKQEEIKNEVRLCFDSNQKKQKQKRKSQHIQQNLNQNRETFNTNEEDKVNKVQDSNFNSEKYNNSISNDQMQTNIDNQQFNSCKIQLIENQTQQQQNKQSNDQKNQSQKIYQSQNEAQNNSNEERKSIQLEESPYYIFEHSNLDNNIENHNQQENQNLNHDNLDQDKEKDTCQTFFYIARLLGSFILLISLGMDIAYYNKNKFNDEGVKNIYKLFVYARPILLGALTIYQICITIQKFYRNKTKIRDEPRQNIPNSQAKYQNNKNHQKKNKKLGQQLYFLVIFPILAYTGCFRLVGQSRYSYSYCNTLIFELTTQTFPLMIFQIHNNRIMGWNIFKIASIVISTLNILDICIEYYLQRHIIKGKEHKFLQICFLKKKNQKKYYLTSILLLGITATLASILMINALYSESGCGQNMYLNGLTCEPCLVAIDNSCLQCSNNTVCEKCNTGYYIDEKNVTFKDCIQCNQTLSHCINCQSDESCLECEQNYFVKDGQCRNCSYYQNCAKCVNGQCVQCEDGYFLEKMNESYSQCTPCSDYLDYCNKCSNKDVCIECSHFSLVAFNNGKCICSLESNSNINSYNDQCECIDGYYQADNICCQNSEYNIRNRCRSCQQIAGEMCKKCYITMDSQLGIQELSDQKYSYVTCMDCGQGQYFNKDKKSCEKCENKFEYCSKCDFDGDTCKKCYSGYVGEVQKSTGFMSCTLCSKFISHCLRCVSPYLCVECQQGYTNKDGFCL